MLYEGRWPNVVAAGIALAAFGCLLAALIASPPHLLGAGVSAILGWLACYAYMLQRDCGQLARSSEGDPAVLGEQSSVEGMPLAQSTTDAGMAGVRPVAPAAAGAQAADLDLTMLAGSLGVSFGDGFLGSIGPAPGSGKRGGTMQAVLMAALVNEYLRCAALLRKYQGRHGKLRNAPSCDLGFAEALLSGLSGDADGGVQSRPPANVVVPEQPGNLLSQATSPTPVRTSPSTSCDHQAAQQIEEKVSPPPVALPAQEAAIVGGNQEKPRVVLSDSDPPWLRKVNYAAYIAPAKEKEADIDISLNDPPWLREIKRAHK